LNKLIPLLTFSILLLVPVGVHEASANHPTILGCPSPGYLVTEPFLRTEFVVGLPDNFCQHSLSNPASIFSGNCVLPYAFELVFDETDVPIETIYVACIAPTRRDTELISSSVPPMILLSACAKQ